MDVTPTGGDCEHLHYGRKLAEFADEALADL